MTMEDELMTHGETLTALSRARSELTTETKRREWAERECERLRRLGVDSDETRMRAESDNAALLEESERRRVLLEAVAKACRGLGPVTPEVEAVVGRVLERMQALEKVREAAESLRRYAAGQGGVTDEACRALVDACATADALKVPRE